jgi:adenylate cyclase
MTEEENEKKELSRRVWRQVFEIGEPELRRQQIEHLSYEAKTRCKLCFVPFDGKGAEIFGKVPSQRNGYFCNACDLFIAANLGGATVTLSVLFADVRNSVGIAEDMDPDDFRELINEFFVAATLPLQNTEGFIIEFIGDAVACVYPPAFCGDHASKAIAGAERILRAKMPTLPNGSELPIGVGVHTGKVSMGTAISALREKGTYHDVQAFGDNVNVAARLCSMAAPREALISEPTLIAAGVPTTDCDVKELPIRGRRKPINAVAINRDQEFIHTRTL